MAGEFIEPTSEKKVHIGSRDISEILQERFERLSAADQSFFQSGSVFLALNGGLCGLVSNSLFRRVLNVTQARIVSALPMAVLPFISTVVAYECFINRPLMEGDLNCATCAWIRGGLIGGVIGCVYPAVLALPLNAALASRYLTTPMPGQENMLRYWMMVCKPVYKKMRFAAILQIAFGGYLASKNHEIYIKMLQLPQPEDPEEIKDKI
ncbi:transmembrane protein 126A-like [Lacerta agilis]|uniref:transmembrane protein 126A-like n=1 Tax=Lacerta agilis TaxID=80427 RepID=UPI001419CD7E|nr:transmembrane protein 126A-like [Lacerta agilis]